MNEVQFHAEGQQTSLSPQLLIQSLKTGLKSKASGAGFFLRNQSLTCIAFLCRCEFHLLDIVREDKVLDIL